METEKKRPLDEIFAVLKVTWKYWNYPITIGNKNGTGRITVPAETMRKLGLDTAILKDAQTFVADESDIARRLSEGYFKGCNVIVAKPAHQVKIE